jgi:hypothetical protein
MICAECGHGLSPGTSGFATRVIVPTRAGIGVILCGSCGDPGKPIGRRWELITDPEALASVGAALAPKT